MPKLAEPFGLRTSKAFRFHAISDVLGTVESDSACDGCEESFIDQSHGWMEHLDRPKRVQNFERELI
jgi:hypothetical protein